MFAPVEGLAAPQVVNMTHQHSEVCRGLSLRPDVQDQPIYIFVAIVPVVMDAIFKYWIFKGLNRQNPAAAVTLKSMDRH